MGHEDYETLVTIIEEVSAIIAEVPELVASSRPMTSLAWLRRARKDLRIATEIIRKNMDTPN